MKALLLYSNNGESYEDYSEWVCAVLSAPDDFDYEADSDSWYAAYRAANPGQFPKEGKWPKRNYAEKVAALYDASLRARFPSIDFTPKSWHLSP